MRPSRVESKLRDKKRRRMLTQRASFTLLILENDSKHRRTGSTDSMGNAAAARAAIPPPCWGNAPSILLPGLERSYRTNESRTVELALYARSPMLLRGKRQTSGTNERVRQTEKFPPILFRPALSSSAKARAALFHGVSN